MPQEEWQALCDEHGYTFRNWHIEHPIRSNEDVPNFVKFLDMISEKYWDLIV